MRERHGLELGADAELRQHPAHVRAHGRLGDVRRRGDRRDAPAAGQAPQHLRLPLGQPGERGERRGAGGVPRTGARPEGPLVLLVHHRLAPGGCGRGGEQHLDRLRLGEHPDGAVAQGGGEPHRVGGRGHQHHPAAGPGQGCHQGDAVPGERSEVEVEQDDVRSLGHDRADQLVRGRERGHRAVDPLLPQRDREALRQQAVVVDHHHAQPVARHAVTRPGSGERSHARRSTTGRTTTKQAPPTRLRSSTSPPCLRINVRAT